MLKLSYLIAVLFTGVLYQTPAALRRPRIVGGSVAPPDKLTYQIGLSRDESTICSGSLIRPDIAVTAAHCVVNNLTEFYLQQMQVIARTNDFSGEDAARIRVTKVYVPRSYYGTQRRASFYNADIAVLRLEESMSLEDLKVSFLSGPVQGRSYEGQVGLVSGSGRKWTLVPDNDAVRKQDRKLRFANATVWSNLDCGRAYGIRVTENILCAQTHQRDPNRPEGLCKGDSGGPLVLEGDVLVGVASMSPLRCNETVRPAIYTRVSYYLDFIQKSIEDLTDPDIVSTYLPL